MKKYMHERVADRGGGIGLVRRECMDREREMEALLPWPSPCGMFPKGMWCQKLKIDSPVLGVAGILPL